MIRSLARNEENVQSSLVCREFRSNRLRSLDYPKMEDFTLYYDIVAVADALMNLSDGVLRISRNDTVHEGAVNTASLLEPSLEFLAKLPQLYVLVDALLEFLSVEEDKFAWKDDESLRHVTLEMLESVVEKLSELAWI